MINSRQDCTQFWDSDDISLTAFLRFGYYARTANAIIQKALRGEHSPRLEGRKTEVDRSGRLETLTVQVIVREPLPGELPCQEANDTEQRHTSRN